MPLLFVGAGVGGGGDGDGGDGDDEMRAQGPLQGLRAVRSVSAREVLVQAVTALPWNWSAWLELAELVALPDAPGIGSGSTSADSGAGAAGTAGAAMRALDSIASCSTGAGGWMSTFFRAHVLLELDALAGREAVVRAGRGEEYDPMTGELVKKKSGGGYIEPTSAVALKLADTQ